VDGWLLCPVSVTTRTSGFLREHSSTTVLHLSNCAIPPRMLICIVQRQSGGGEGGCTQQGWFVKGGQGVMCCVKFVEYFHPLAVNLREGVGELLHMGHVWIQAVRLTFDCLYGCSHLPFTRARQMGSMLGNSSLTTQFSRPSSSILEDKVEKKRFFRGERKTSGCVTVGVVTTVPGRKVERKVWGWLGILGRPGVSRCLSLAYNIRCGWFPTMWTPYCLFLVREGSEVSDLCVY
jgi:hypothetical protein